MSKQRKWKTDTGDEISLIGHALKDRPYLWIGKFNGHLHAYFTSISNPRTLRSLANAILEEVGDGKKKEERK